jgi:hypothetical protein
MDISCYSHNPNSRKKFFRFVTPLVLCLINKEGRVFLYQVAKLLRNKEKESFLKDLKNIKKFYFDLENENIYFMEIIKHLNDIYNQEKHIRNYRGAVLEVFAYELLKNKYDNENTILCIDCYVRVFKKNKLKQSQKTIDVFAFDKVKDNGECYECKITDGFEEKDIKNLNNITLITDDKLSTGIISFFSSEAIKMKINDIADKNKDLNIDNLNILGQVELKGF